MCVCVCVCVSRNVLALLPPFFDVPFLFDDSFCEVLRCPNAQSNASKRVDGCSADVARSHARACCDKLPMCVGNGGSRDELVSCAIYWQGVLAYVYMETCAHCAVWAGQNVASPSAGKGAATEFAHQLKGHTCTSKKGLTRAHACT